MREREYYSLGLFDVRQGDIAKDSKKPWVVSATRRRQAVGSVAATGTGVTRSVALPLRRVDVTDAVYETTATG